METIITTPATMWEARTRLQYMGSKYQKYLDAIDEAADTHGVDEMQDEPDQRVTIQLPNLYRLSIYRQTGITLAVAIA